MHDTGPQCLVHNLLTAKLAGNSDVEITVCSKTCRRQFFMAVLIC